MGKGGSTGIFQYQYFYHQLDNLFLIPFKFPRDSFEIKFLKM